MPLLRAFAAWTRPVRLPPGIVLDGRVGPRSVVVAAAIVIVQTCAVAWALSAVR